MNSQYVNRIIRACKLDVSLYEEVEADKSATLQAASVVVLSSLAAGAGAISLGASNFLMAPLLSLVSWYIWAYLIYLIGAKLFPEPTTKSDHGELLRTIGCSSAPGIIRVFGFFFLIFAPSVKLRKKGKFPIVSMVTKSNIKEFIKVAIMLVFHISSWQ